MLACSAGLSHSFARGGSEKLPGYSDGLLGRKAQRDLERRPANVLRGGHVSAKLKPNTVRVTVNVNCICVSDGERDESHSFRCWHRFRDDGQGCGAAAPGSATDVGVGCSGFTVGLMDRPDVDEPPLAPCLRSGK